MRPVISVTLLASSSCYSSEDSNTLVTDNFACFFSIFLSNFNFRLIQHAGTPFLIILKIVWKMVTF